MLFSNTVSPFFIENENEFLHRRLLSINHGVTDQSNVSTAVLNQLKRLEGVVLRKHLDDDDEDDDFGDLPPKNLEDFFSLDDNLKSASVQKRLVSNRSIFCHGAYSV
jgi:hypothetical protein